MMNLILRILIWPYHMATRRFYFISGTFIDADGKRMFFRQVFETSMFRFPLQQMEEHTGKFLPTKDGRALITGIQRIPRWMAREISPKLERREADFEIEYRKP